jgi:hypothetical protein
MSPSASLAHYKSNLDPPPAVPFCNSEKLGGDDRETEEESENVRTPSKKRGATTGGIFPPVTPKRLIFPGVNSQDSPYRTPGSRLGVSPFRTPGSRGIFDPHDAGVLLDEELSRLGSGKIGVDSPLGSAGRYDSPSALSINWNRWW